MFDQRFWQLGIKIASEIRWKVKSVRIQSLPGNI